MDAIRTVFFVSDRTGVTVESLGHTLLTQFSHIEFKRTTIPFVDTVEKAQGVSEQICKIAKHDQLQPIIFMSIIDPDVRKVFEVNNNAIIIDFFDAFITPLEQALGQSASLSVGKAHGMVNEEQYDYRMEAVNFSLHHDDGIKLKDLDEADVILIGVSRSGKTPTCLYMALQYGIRAANYPLTPEDLSPSELPSILLPFRSKMFGLTIDPARLHHIRSERRPNSKYARLDNCKREVVEAECIFRQYAIPFISTTHKSIEEIASNIMHKATLGKRF